jgi:hypothetical protein
MLVLVRQRLILRLHIGTESFDAVFKVGFCSDRSCKQLSKRRIASLKLFAGSILDGGDINPLDMVGEPVGALRYAIELVLAGLQFALVGMLGLIFV